MPGNEIMGLSRAAWGALVAIVVMVATAAFAYSSIVNDVDGLQRVETGQTQDIQAIKTDLSAIDRDLSVLSVEVKKNRELTTAENANILRAIEAIQ